MAGRWTSQLVGYILLFSLPCVEGAQPYPMHFRRLRSLVTMSGTDQVSLCT
jgi:hypothetical protein